MIITAFISCESCAHHQSRDIEDKSGKARHGSICGRIGTSTAFERDSIQEPQRHGDKCGPSGKNWQRKS
jgi:hypothetical protein